MYTDNIHGIATGVKTTIVQVTVNDTPKQPETEDDLLDDLVFVVAKPRSKTTCRATTTKAPATVTALVKVNQGKNTVRVPVPMAVARAAKRLRSAKA